MDAGSSFLNLWMLEDVNKAQISVVVFSLHLPTSNSLFFSHLA